MDPVEPSEADILIVVPKADEMRAVAAVLGLETDEEHGRLNGKYRYWQTRVASLGVIAVEADAQGSSRLALVTRAAIDRFDPAVCLCVGTAAGRADRTTYLDVVIATANLDATEWRVEPAGLQPSWDNAAKPTKDSLSDIDEFLKSGEWLPIMQEVIQNQKVLSATGEPLLPSLTDGWVATTAFLHQDEAFLQTVWNLHSRLRAVDMETAGFVQACTDGPSPKPWYVVRSVSDYGTRESKLDGLRPAAGVVASAAALAFITRGLKRTHPLRVKPAPAASSDLSAGNFYVSSTMATYFRERLKRELGLDIEHGVLAGDITFRDLTALCRGSGSRGNITSALETMREDYFTEKYQNYDDTADVRAYVGDAWIEEINSIFAYLGVQVPDCDVLYVGVGVGRDVPDILPDFRSLVGVDISIDMLRAAKILTPRMEIHRDSAERLLNVSDSTIDLYVSLRTFQSSLLDPSESLRQAVRVMRPGSSIVISIPSNFVDTVDGRLMVVPGLLIPGTTVVDPSRPRRIADRIMAKMQSLSFERISYHQLSTDLYIYATRPAEVA